MNRLEQLLNDLCPDGVEFKPIKEVYTRLKGTPITAGKMKEIENPNGDIRVFAGGKTVIDANEKDIPNANITRVPAVLVQSRGVIDAIYYDKPFTFKNEMWAYTHENIICVKFLYYIIKNNVNHFREAASGMGSLPQISLSVTEDFVIPVPPLEVQAEIVRILDKFTELEAELDAELEARKKQYEYYRDKLLTYSKDNMIIEYKALGETCEMKAGKAISASELSENADNIHVYKCYGGNGIRGYISKVNYEGDYPIIGRQGALCGNVQYAVGKFYATEHAVVVNSKGLYLQRFLYHLLSQMNLNQYKSAGAQPGLAVNKLETISAPVPPLEVQQRIVNVLDNFEAICSDLQIGLPAEIEARKKQYEYYRDLLLSFDNSQFVNVERERERR